MPAQAMHTCSPVGCSRDLERDVFPTAIAVALSSHKQRPSPAGFSPIRLPSNADAWKGDTQFPAAAPLSGRSPGTSPPRAPRPPTKHTHKRTHVRTYTHAHTGIHKHTQKRLWVVLGQEQGRLAQDTWVGRLPSLCCVVGLTFGVSSPAKRRLHVKHVLARPPGCARPKYAGAAQTHTPATLLVLQ